MIIETTQKMLAFGSIGWAEILVILIVPLIIIIPFWKICSKAGFSPWWSLLAYVPFGFILLLWGIALAKWRPTTLSHSKPT